MSTTKACVYGHASLRSVDVHTIESYSVSAGLECWRRRGAAQEAEYCCRALLFRIDVGDTAVPLCVRSSARVA